MKMSLSVKTIHLCETAFQDKQNRWNLIGIYTGNIIVRSFPAELNKAIYFEFEASDGQDFHLEFFVGRQPMARAQVKLVRTNDQNSAALAPFVIPVLKIGLEKPAVFKIVLNVDGKKPRTIFRRKIKLGELSG